MALRATPAKGLALGAIAGTFTVAAILLGWPKPPVTRDARTPDADQFALLASRTIAIDIVDMPLAGKRPTALWTPRHAPAARPPVAASSVEAVSRLIAGTSPEPATETPAARSVEEPPVLPSRSIAVGSNLMRVSSVSFETPEASRESGALTRAIDSTAGAFRTAGSSVATAFRKVF